MPKRKNDNDNTRDNEDIKLLDIDYSKNLISLINVVNNNSFAENIKRSFDSTKIIVNELSEI